MINTLLETSSRGRLLDGFAGPAAESHRSPRESAAGRWPMFEPLEARVLLSGDVLTAALQGGEAMGGLTDIHKLIVAGDPDGDPADSPGDRVDANTTASPYAGVGSLWVDAPGPGGYIGSATAIGPNHVLTAAHMLDLRDNGRISVKPQNVVFILNYGSDYSHEIPASALYVHSDWTGFNNPSVNDDIAIIELSEPLPPGVPIYPLSTTGWTDGEAVTFVGYGRSGDGVNGYYVDPEFEVKRTGANETDLFELDDEETEAKEVFLFDFDGGVENWRTGSIGLGNLSETTLGGGDSGGPAFRAGTGGLEVYGVNTFSFSWSGGPAAPLFGSGAGGIVVAPYVDWINSIVGGLPAVPGVSVTPTSGLVTREAGDTAEFTVVLDTQPTADVTIGLSSSDTTEGIVDETPLTFSTTNWATPQPVTVTGVDDDILDGDMAYTIVTAAASSSDANYSGLDAADVSVTNLDDEEPSVETPTVISVVPNSGDPGERLTVTIKGTHFQAGATANFGDGVIVQKVTFVESDLLDVVIKIKHFTTTGSRDVTVTNPDSSSGTLAGGFNVVVSESSSAHSKVGQSIPLATGLAIHAAEATAVSAAARQRADVSIPLTVGDLPPLAVYSTTTGYQQSPRPQLVDPLSGAFEDAPAGDESAVDMDLDLRVLGGELLDKLVLLL